MGRVVLVDGNGLLFRAFKALPTTLQTPEGQPTNAVFGFAKMFRRVLRGQTPSHLAVVFDTGGSAARRALYPAYKAHRPRMPERLKAQLTAVDDLVLSHNAHVVRHPGVEADDVIATLTRQALVAGHEVWIVSDDKDFAQLVGPKVSVLQPTPELLLNPDGVFRKWGVRPGQFVDYLALIGDRADNLPGVPGVGPKKAAALLARHGDLPGLARAGALGEHQAAAERSARLAQLDTQVPLTVNLSSLRYTPPEAGDLNAVYRRYAFFSMLAPEHLSASGEKPEYFVVDRLEMLAGALEHETQGRCAVHLVIEYPGPITGDLVGLAWSPRPGRALYVPLRGASGLGELGWRQLEAWLGDPDRSKVFHEAKHAYVACAQLGTPLRGVVGDTALASYLADPTRCLPHRLEQVSRAVLQRALQPVKTLTGGGRDFTRFAELPVDRLGAYACHLADAIGALWPPLRERVAQLGLLGHLKAREMPLSEVLADIERTGMPVDPDALDGLHQRFCTARDAAAEALFEAAGTRFNPGSHRQVGTLLFETLQLPVIKRTKTGYSTDATVLDQLRDAHPVVPLLLEWRTWAKLVDGYTEVLRRAVQSDGRIHATLQQTASASGRLITAEPDLQRTPIRTEAFRQVRRAFCAPEHRTLISADWSQIELRLLAHYSQDPVLLDAYRTGRDVHATTAAQLFGVSIDHVSKRQREVGKTVNFATIYGQGPLALAHQLRISRAEAAHYIETFFETYAGVRQWRKSTIAAAYVDGYVTTLLGRRRRLPELATPNRTDQAYGERIAVNTPIQGSAADLCKLAMLRAHALLDGLDARLVLSIHDELVVEASQAATPEVKMHLETAMTEVWPLTVPLVVEVGEGRTWADAH